MGKIDETLVVCSQFKDMAFYVIKYEDKFEKTELQNLREVFVKGQEEFMRVTSKSTVIEGDHESPTRSASLMDLSSLVRKKEMLMAPRESVSMLKRNLMKHPLTQPVTSQMRLFVKLALKRLPEMKSQLQKGDMFHGMIRRKSNAESEMEMAKLTSPNKVRTKCDVLHSMLLNFVATHDSLRDIGYVKSLFDYATIFGEDILNEKLLHCYGRDLLIFEEEEIAHAKLMKEEIKIARRKQKRLAKLDPDVSTKRLRRMLCHFFNEVDPQMLMNDFEPLLELVEDDGEEELEAQLFDRYKRSFKEVCRELTARRKSVRDMEDQQQIEDLVRLFYKAKSAASLSEKQLEQVFEWMAEHGVKALDLELKKEFGISLSKFKEDAKFLESELAAFYKVYDPKVLAEKEPRFQRVFLWGLRNGREALDKELKCRYNVGLSDGL